MIEKKESIKSNFIFQSLYQIIILVIPLIISPYLTRILGSESLGIYTYVNSIASYFILFANLGIAKYGQRVISSNVNNEENLRKTFWSLYFVHFISSIVMVIIYVLFVSTFCKEYKIIYFINIIYVFSVVFDVTWLFYGLEAFKNVVVKNALIKLCECISIFIFVKKNSDLWLYCLIMCISTKPMLILFISVVAATLYTVFDKTLLGILARKQDVAFYEYANKIINVPKQLIYVIGTVMLPRACKAYSEKDFDKQKKYIDYSMLATIGIGFLFMYGFFALGKEFAIIYYGEEFLESGNAIVLMAPLILIVMVGDVIRSEYLIPAKKDIAYVLCISISAIINLIISFLLIPTVGIYGAIFGTISAEIFGTCFQLIFLRKIYPIKKLFNNIFPFMIIGITMFIILYFLNIYLPHNILFFIIKALIGGIIYILFSLIYFIIFKKEILKELKNKIHK